MATVPVQRTWTANYKVAAADMNANVRDAVNFLLNPPAVQSHQGTAQSIPNATTTAITLDTNDQNTDSPAMWVTGSNTRFTCQTAGTYLLSGAVSFAGNATGLREALFRVNGVTITLTAFSPAPNATPMVVAAPTMRIHLNVGDYVELCGYQSSGAALNTATAPNGTYALAQYVSTL